MQCFISEKTVEYVIYILNSSTTFPLLLNVFPLPVHDGSRDRTIGIATSYGLNSRRLAVRVPVDRGVSRVWQAGQVPWAQLAGGASWLGII
jgi:hypothetical protein